MRDRVKTPVPDIWLIDLDMVQDGGKENRHNDQAHQQLHQRSP